MFAIRFDEATNCNKNVHLICYVCFIDGINFAKELLFFKPIFGSTKGKDLFKITNKFMNHNNIKWENRLSGCTNSAPAIVGPYNGLQNRL